MAEYFLWYVSPAGVRVAPITDAVSIEWVRVFGDVGKMKVIIPRRGQIYDNTAPDYRILLYRQPDNGALGIEFSGFVDVISPAADSMGRELLTFTLSDPNALMTRRIAAYYAGEAETSVSGTADDVMKEVVRDNYINNADYSGTPSPTRSISTYLTVDADTSDGPTIAKAFAWQYILSVLQDMQANSKTGGNEVFWSVEPVTETSFQFRTYTGQPGNDRTITGANPVIFSPEWGNLDNPLLSYDYGSERNFIYAGGQGQGDQREVQTASDTGRITASPLGRKEGFAYATQAQTATAVTARANEILAEQRRKLIFTGNLLSTPVTPYGGLNGWKLGDKVTINFTGRQFDAVIRSVHGIINEQGHEIIRGRVENVNA